MLKVQLKRKVTRLKFEGIAEEVWESLASNPPEVVFIAPVNDTVPSPFGNAVYNLIEQLCVSLPYSCAVLARWPINGRPSACALSRRILYYRGSMRPTFLERILPYRLKVFIWGLSSLHQRRYANLAGRVVRCLGAKVVIIEDTPGFGPPVRASVGRSAKIILHQHCEKPSVLTTLTWLRLVKSIDGVVFVAKRTLKLAEKLHGRLNIPSLAIYCGVDLNHYCPEKWQGMALNLRTRLGISPGSRILLFVGRLVSGKGVAEAAEAFNQADIPNVHMIIVGNLNVTSQHDDYLKRLRKSASVSCGRIHLVGTIIQDELPAYYQASDVVILPSIDREGLPKIILEALAMGRPIIASDRGGIWELLDVNRNAWLIRDPKDSAMIAKVLEDAFQDKRRLDRMKKAILVCDRPKVCQKKMIVAFAEKISLFFKK